MGHFVFVLDLRSALAKGQLWLGHARMDRTRRWFISTLTTQMKKCEKRQTSFSFARQFIRGARDLIKCSDFEHLKIGTGNTGKKGVDGD